MHENRPSHMPRRILLVEDDVVLRDLVRAILDEDGYAVTEATAPSEAAAILRRSAFDLVITDGFTVGPSDALSAADLVREAGETPVALFTAQSVARQQALATGFVELIAKPFDLGEFERRVRTLLASAG